MCQSRSPRSISRRENNAMMNRWQKLASVTILASAMALGGPGSAAAQTKPDGEMRFALYVTVTPALLDPGEAVLGNLTPFWMLYALHDALVKPMPGNPMAGSLAESWSMSEDQRVYEFTLRKGLKFHNGDPFTAEDVVFSFKRAKGVQLHEKVKEVVIVDPHKVQFVLHEPWPDFMAVYGTLVSAAGWITPKNYFEKVGADGSKAHPIGLGPYKFVSMKPGLELVMEANEDYWRKVPSVKRLVFQSVPEGSTRLAMLKAGEVDVAYLLEGQRGESIRNDANFKLVFSGGIGTFFLDFFDMWDPKSPFADQRVRKAASLAIDRQALSDADTLGASKPNGLCFCATAEYGNASTRMAVIVPTSGSLAYGGYPDIDELYQRQLTETDPAKREVMLHQIQKTLHERTRFAPIFDYFWPSGIGPRVEEVSLMKIDPFPWSAPLEDVRLKRP